MRAAFAFVLVAILFTVVPAAARPKPAGPSDDAQRQAAWARHQQLERESPFHGLAWRALGPTAQGGRVVDIEPIPGMRHGFYVAYASGGVWKTTNNGAKFEPLSDALPTLVTGDIATDANNPQRLWIGSGEPNSSRSSYGGMGVFRSDDGGATFRAAGLADSDRIARVMVDPKDGEHVCVAALGKLYSTGGERGVYCTRDGGGSWTQTLAGDTPWTGAIDLVVDPRAPDTWYAAMWDRSRTPWNLVEGGSGSGIYKSTDGARSWKRLAGGFPQGDKIGRIGLALAPSQPGTVYASVDNWSPLPDALVEYGDRPLNLKTLRRMDRDTFLRQDPEEIEEFIRDQDLDSTLDAAALVELVRSDKLTLKELIAKLEAKDTGFGAVDVWGLEVYRSDDAGDTWRRTHEEPLRDVTYTYGYYFGTIVVAPDDAQQVYVVGVPIVGSSDGGRTWNSLQRNNVHPDYHAWWIDPEDPAHMMVGNDGGIDVSWDRGRTWTGLDAQPVGQFYTVALDLAEPYNAYGGLQDNGTWKGPSSARWEQGETWAQIGGGDGMHVAVDTRDNATVYTGYQFGFYQRSGPGGTTQLRPRERLKEPALRYNWNAPLLLSQHNQDVVYYGANRLFRSMDQGDSWQAISPDLSRSKQRGDVPYATITSVSESPRQFGVIWAGTDDGHVWVTRSNGDEWSAVDGALPQDRWVSRVIASAHVRERAYVALNGYRNDDPGAYLFVTEDFGRSWRSIAAGLPAESVNVVREDPLEANVLYVGTDRGVYASTDRGAHWHALQQGLPNVPVHDLAVHPRERELVAATHGRSMWLVDVLPVQEYEALQDERVRLFPVAPLQADRGWRSSAPRWFDDSDSLPKVHTPYWAGSAGKATLTVLDADKRPLRRVALDARRGINAASWDLQLDPELALAAERKAAAAAKGEGALAKARYAESVRLRHRLYALPGNYTLRLELDGASSETAFELKPPEDRKPRIKAKPKIRGR